MHLKTQGWLPVLAAMDEQDAARLSRILWVTGTVLWIQTGFCSEHHPL